MMGILQTDSFTVDKKVTRIGLKLAGQNVDQGAFPGTVFAQQRVDLARMQDEVHAFQCQRIAEAFTDAEREDDRMNAHLFYRIANFVKVLATF